MTDTDKGFQVTPDMWRKMQEGREALKDFNLKKELENATRDPKGNSNPRQS